MGHFHLYWVMHIDGQLLKVLLLPCHGIDDETPRWVGISR